MPDAPAAAPVSTAAPLPTAPPSAAESNPQNGVDTAFDQAFGNLKTAIESDAAAPAPDGKKADAPTKPEGTQQPPADTQDKPPQTQTQTPPADPNKQQATTTEKPVEQMAPKELRRAYSETKAKLRDVETQLKELKSKPPTTADDPEKKLLAEKAAAAEKRLAELDGEMRYIDYERSSEFKEKYQKPYLDTCTTAAKAISQLLVPTEDGGSRAATMQDFWEIVKIPNAEQALTMAEQLFGSAAKANYVMQFRDKVTSAWEAQEKAKQEYREKGGERFKEMSAARQKEAAEALADFKRHSQEAIEKYPDWFTAPEGDAKGKELLEKGFAFADKAFGDLDPKQAPAIHAALRNKAAGFDYAIYRLTSAQKKIDALEKELSAFKASAPGAGTPPGAGGGASDGMSSFEAKLDALAR